MIKITTKRTFEVPKSIVLWAVYAAAAVHYSRDRYHVCWCKRGRSLVLKLYIDAVYSKLNGTKAQRYNS